MQVVKWDFSGAKEQFMEMIASARLGFLKGVFLVKSLDNLTRTTKRQNTYQLKLTINKKYPE